MVRAHIKEYVSWLEQLTEPPSYMRLSPKKRLCRNAKARPWMNPEGSPIQLLREWRHLIQQQEYGLLDQMAQFSLHRFESPPLVVSTRVQVLAPSMPNQRDCFAIWPNVDEAQLLPTRQIPLALHLLAADNEDQAKRVDESLCG
jgi:hypothetical protein